MTLDGAYGAYSGNADDVGLGVAVGVGGGLVEELEGGIGREEEPGGGATPPQVPKPGLHPLPQKSMLLPTSSEPRREDLVCTSSPAFNTGLKEAKAPKQLKAPVRLINIHCI
ncbi:hypothetical protein DDE83_004421 [Stemphylium lycopersici]|uniref:Uncharacterized protein n=1 Tax=Stemphylium lycopersici TaxID=183478 RepID=A0A364N4M4_STELY|nr:hypothetical protein DDE83_004421 [Stemphylium lycopersici]